MMWDSSLCAVNKESALGVLQCRTGQGRNSKQIEKERVGGVKEMPCNCPRRQTGDFTR